MRKTDSEESLSSVDRAASPAKEDVKETKARKAKKETVDLTKIKDDERLVLDPNGKEWNGLYKEAKADMGNMAPSRCLRRPVERTVLTPVHGAGESKVQSE